MVERLTFNKDTRGNQAVASSNGKKFTKVSSGPYIFKMGKKFTVLPHALVPKHVKLNDTEVKKLFEKYSITAKELPKILKADPVVTELNVDAGDVIKIVRQSKTAGETVYYREVVDE